MPPDAENIMLFIGQVFTPVITVLGGFTAAVFALIFLFSLFQELFDNAHQR